jgi:hypothetical protein
MDQLSVAKPLCKAAFRVLHAADIGIGIARAIRAAVSGRPGGVYLDLPAKLFGQVMDAEKGRKSLVKVIDAAPAQIRTQQGGDRPYAWRHAVELESKPFQNYNRVRESAGGEILPGFSAVHRPRNNASGRQNEQCLRA